MAIAETPASFNVIENTQKKGALKPAPFFVPLFRGVGTWATSSRAVWARPALRTCLLVDSAGAGGYFCAVTDLLRESLP